MSLQPYFVHYDDDLSRWCSVFNNCHQDSGWMEMNDSWESGYFIGVNKSVDTHVSSRLNRYVL